MAIKIETKEFTKPGRVAKDATPEKFTCSQVTEDSVSSDSPDNFLTDVLELANGDLATAATIVREGYNRWSRIEASGSDEATKLAKAIVKGGMASVLGLGGKEVSEIAVLIRDGKVKVG